MELSQNDLDQDIREWKSKYEQQSRRKSDSDSDDPEITKANSKEQGSSSHYPQSNSNVDSEASANNNKMTNNNMTEAELQEEAEMLKGVGNRHMASQDYNKAYAAYTSALQYSPLGPASHIYLSNRAAALLSLKRYSAASVDARRAITLAPTFGKAHARLGQSLYFLKDYEGAVAAYEDAFRYEPENQVTWTYLNKAKKKLARSKDKKKRRSSGTSASARAAAIGAAAGTELDHADGGESVGESIVSKFNGALSITGAEDEKKAINTSVFSHGDDYSQNTDNEHGILKQPSQTKGDRVSQSLRNKVRAVVEDQELSVSSSNKPTTIDSRVARSKRSYYDDYYDKEQEEKQKQRELKYKNIGEYDNIPPSSNRRGQTTTTNDELPKQFQVPHLAGKPGDTIQQEPSPIHHPQQEDPDSSSDDGEDPAFDEALRLHESATHKLHHKRYREAVEEFSAALFLVPDDDNLTPQLFIGRANAHNGLRRHQSAQNDAMMALGRNSNLLEAHVVLARSLFYKKDFVGTVQSFENAKDCVDGQETQLSNLDELYLEKALEALENTENDDENNRLHREVAERGYSMLNQSTKPVPKLEPPRFVSRKKMLDSDASVVPPIPKSWSRQVPLTPPSLQVGPEREIKILSDYMGIKLNRGPDGVVRVLSVTEMDNGSIIAREGHLECGDVVREAAGVDLRRPITKVMWSDTVALLKISPRPVKLLVAIELSERPVAVDEEVNKANATPQAFPVIKPILSPSSVNDNDEISSRDDVEEWKNMPQSYGSYSKSPKSSRSIRSMISRSSGKEPVADSMQAVLDDDDLLTSISVKESEGAAQNVTDSPLQHDKVIYSESDSVADIIIESGSIDELKAESKELWVENTSELKDDTSASANLVDKIPIDLDGILSDYKNKRDGRSRNDLSSGLSISAASFGDGSNISIGQDELSLKKEVVFIPASSDKNDTNSQSQNILGWTNEKWLATSAIRTLSYFGEAYQITKGRFFWSGEQYIQRTLAIFHNPDLLIMLRQPESVKEICEALNIPNELDDSQDETGADLMNSFLVAETVVDLKTCKLRLSPLTTFTSITLPSSSDANVKDQTTPQNDNINNSICLDLLTPVENFFLSAITKDEIRRDKKSDDDAAAAATARLENEIAKALCIAHASEYEEKKSDNSWKHQIILGSLHSHVVSGNFEALKRVLNVSNKAQKKRLEFELDKRDEDGMTALHYACISHSNTAVSLLLKAGADCTIPTQGDIKSPCHLCAERLDEKSLSMVLSTSQQPHRPNPNAQDAYGQTPMHAAILHGKSIGGASNPLQLNKCLSALEAWGGKICLQPNNMQDALKLTPHPIHSVSSEWRYPELDVLFSFCPHQYPIASERENKFGISLGSLFDYPIHACLIALRKNLLEVKRTGRESTFDSLVSKEKSLPSTLRVLLNHGLEPNERIEYVTGGSEFSMELNEMIGYSPLQILAAAALDIHTDCVESKENGVKSKLQFASFYVNEAVAVLISFGARMTLDAPPISRPHRENPFSNLLTPSNETGEINNLSDLRHIDRELINMQKNDEIINIFGGKDRIKQKTDEWSNNTSVNGSGHQIPTDKNFIISMKDIELPGGNDSKSCSICWKTFGVMRNRKHTCRISRRHVCEDCSLKFVMQGGTSYRVSDGQHNLVKYVSENKKEENRKNYESKTELRRLRIKEAQAARSNRARAREAEEEANRDALFGETASSIGQAMKSMFFEEEDKSAELSTNDQITGVASSLNKTRDALNERGQRLSSLSEKTQKLNEASSDFAKMARELKESQQKGLFW